MTLRTEILASDILDVEAYGAIRKQRRSEMVALKKNRRLAVGPYATMFFENYETMLYQVHEMMFTERGGAAQVVEELEAYNPLVPKGNELVVTLMIEVEDPAQREKLLYQLGGIEETISIDVDGDKVMADWERDVDRTTADGKTSAVHFLHFRFSDAQAKQFRDKDVRAVVDIGHRAYGHMAVIPAEMRSELIGDLG